MKIHKMNKNTRAYKDLCRWAEKKVEVAALNKAERAITDRLEAAASEAVQTQLAEIRKARFILASEAESIAVTSDLRYGLQHGHYPVSNVDKSEHWIVVRGSRRATETITVRAN